jgi:predicted transposase YdaD
MPAHDNAYKNIFSHRQVVADLLTGFVGEDWVRAVDLDTLDKCNGSYVSDDLRDRQDDIVWRVRRGDEVAYVYLLLEFQSSADAWMALRIMVYVGLLYQDMIKAGEVAAPGRLPAVFPIVIYNPPWQTTSPASGGAGCAGGAAGRIDVLRCIYKIAHEGSSHERSNLYFPGR